MSQIEALLKNITPPQMIRIRQTFPLRSVGNIDQAVQQQLRQDKIASLVKPGMRIAVGVGSRGMASIKEIARKVVSELQQQGALPFIIPAMGSHGGATDEGQREVLARLGVTERYCGCPIYSSMETVEVGRLDDGMPVLIDKHAAQADAIVIINRVKAHSGFVGPNESGLIKMITIGLGKQQGADACHAQGWSQMARLVVEMAKVKLAACPILFGVATYENAEDQVAEIIALTADEMLEEEQMILKKAKDARPRILVNPIDVLIVDQLGKEFSGSGMDPYVTGRAATPYLTGIPTQVASLAVLDVSDYSHGNCSGMGIADITTRRLFNKVDMTHTYANTLTSRAPNSSKIPLVMENDLLAIKAAIQVCAVPDMAKLRIVRIPNTGHLGEILISDPLLKEAAAHPDIDIVSEPFAMDFDSKGNLTDLAGSDHH